MKIPYEELAQNIRAAVSRELHLADIPHDQAQTHVTISEVPVETMEQFETERVFFSTGDMLRTKSGLSRYPSGLLIWSETIPTISDETGETK